VRLSNVLFLVLFLGAAWVQAEEEVRYKPYVLASTSADSVKTNLQAQGFKVVGEYESDANVKVIVVTNEELKTTAAQSTTNGGFGAIMRVAITNGVVSYTNPPYWANAYRMKTELGGVVTALKKALGNNGEFGSEYGMSQNELRQYYYAPFMPYFDETVELETYPTYQKCTETVEAGLKSEEGAKAQTQFVYRVNIPNKKETVFGMAVFGESEGTDTNVMTTLNESTGKPEHTAYMPYEILCSDTKALILPAKFRIAISFPELKMWPFMMIRGAPDGIKEAAKAAAQLIKNN